MAFDSKKNAVKTYGRRIQKNVSEKKHSYSHERAADKDNTAPRSYQQFELGQSILEMMAIHILV